MLADSNYSKELKSGHPELPVMILTAHDSLANAIESIKLGAFHFLPKPYAVEELISLCHRALEQQALVEKTIVLEKEKAQLQVRLRAAEEQLEPVALSRRMREVEQILARVAPSEANVLLTGESGVGKEVIARRIHERSTRAGATMVKLNCGAFPANMIESELFGYAKGAFTGAVTAFPGMLAEANGGTLFLDEMTEMPVELQTRFLARASGARISSARHDEKPPGRFPPDRGVQSSARRGRAGGVAAAGSIFPAEDV